jgi:hypothetical protein
MISVRGEYDVSPALGVGTNIDITGLVLTPDLLFVQMCQAAPNGLVNEAMHSEGMAITGPLQSCLIFTDDDNAGSSNARSGLLTDRVAGFFGTNSETDEGSLEFISFLAAGFRLRVKTQFVVQRTIQWVAVNCQGAVLEMGTLTAPAVAGAVVTATTVPPEMLVVFGAENFGAMGNQVRVSIGLAASAAQQCVAAAMSQDGSAAASCQYYGNNIDIMGYRTGAAVINRANLSAVGALSFTLFYAITPGAVNCGRYLMIGAGGSDAFGGEFLSVMDIVTVRTQAGMPFRPGLVLTVSAGHVESAGGVWAGGTYHINLGFGLDNLMGGVYNQGIETCQVDGSDPMQATSIAENGECYMIGTKPAGVIAVGRVKAFLNDGFEFIMDDADTATNWIGYVAGNFAGASADVALL